VNQPFLSSSAKQPGQSYGSVALHTLNAFAVDVMTIPNANDLLWYVAQNVVGKLNFVDCVIYTADLDETVLTQAAAMGAKNPFGRSIVNPLRIPFGQGITGRVAQSREAIIVDDLLDDQSYISDTEPARAEICVPMIFGNRVVGVIDSEHPEPGAFGAAELEILTTVAAMASAKLELLEEAERSDRRYRDLVQSHAQLTRETSNRKALEAELFEIRRLEAIGRLSGGFAHDFNNILTVISGNLDLLDATDAIGDPTAEMCLSDARTAASKGASLIRSMLAFSQRSRLEPKPVDLHELVQSTVQWSKQILPDNVEVTVQAADALWGAHVDRNAAENALLNLILNARDAMPGGGRLAFEIDNFTYACQKTGAFALQLIPGDYVRLSVRDSGTGIAEHNLQKIFDPFYTSKPAGSGTGLGLSTVFGFMQQSGGAVTAASILGEGTTFHLYFTAQTRAGVTFR
jgi:signal transduction histidine kinase